MKDRPEPPAAGFLGRWAQRKSAARRGGERVEEKPAPAADEPVEATGADVTADAPAAVESHAPNDETSVVAGAGEDEKPPLPPIESLTPDSDFSAFMSPDVDAALRRAALRKLFHSPAMNVTDGLDDYAEDYTTFAPLGDIITSDMRHQAEVAAERAERQRLAAGGEAVTDEAPPALDQASTPAETQAGVGDTEEAAETPVGDAPTAPRDKLAAEAEAEAEADDERRRGHPGPSGGLTAEGVPSPAIEADGEREPVERDAEARHVETSADAPHGDADDTESRTAAETRPGEQQRE